MNTTELSQRWNSITHPGAAPYRSLRFSADCLPELYIALDIKGDRHLILQVPEGTSVSCKPTEMANLSLSWHPETRFILISLLNRHFLDLFNDLALSIYNRIKDSRVPKGYTEEFINAFHRWAEFFEDALSSGLPASFLKGLFGELTVLRWYLENDTGLFTDQILSAWQGPYNRTQDFNFPAYDLEVKTKDAGEASISISSEFQLQAAPSKPLELAIVHADLSPDGMTLQQLVILIRSIILAKGGDLPVFLKTMARAGLNFNSAGVYNQLNWKASAILFYNCLAEGFPKITGDHVPDGISQISYSIQTTALQPFLTRQIQL